MGRKVKIVGLGGSLDGSSSSLAALTVALEAAGDAGAEIELLDLHEMRLPMFEFHLSETPAVRQFVETMAAADGHIWSSPLYHGTVSGAFKNAVDWLELLNKRQPPYLTDKVVGLIGTAGGMQGLQAINTMEFIVRSLRGWTVPLTVPVARAWQAFDENGHPKEESVDRQLKALGREVARAAAVFCGQHLTTPDATRAASEINPITVET